VRGSEDSVGVRPRPGVDNFAYSRPTFSFVPALLTLTTDFGLEDAYVGAMKGVVATHAPEVRVVDITHAVAAQDVMEAAWVLRQAVPYFPEGTVHLAVVDPGVGTGRRPIACRIAGHIFVGPDNGLFSLLLGPDVLGPEVPESVVALDRPSLWRTASPSRTFHGRDVFAPLAARLANGARLEDIGTPVPPDSLMRLQWVRPRADEQGVQGWVMHIDHFGNAVTNIPASLVDDHRAGREVRCYAGSTILDGIRETYASVASGEPLVLVGSTGHLEVSVNSGHAAELLSLIKGSAVSIVFGDRRS
jgi:S-adenosyl-L-methionine hydrolase (adenosine-forming)